MTPAATAPGPAAETPWERLHPLSPVVRGGRAVVALLVVLAVRQVQQQGRPGGDDGVSQLVVDGVVAAVVVVAGGIRWLVTRWRVHDGDLQIKTGLVRRQSTRVNLTRIQAIDVVRAPLARLLGTSELRLVLAGGGGGNTTLAYLGKQRALTVRAQLLALAHGLDDSTPEPAERPAAAVRNGRLLAGVLLSAGTVVAVLYVALTSVAVTVGGAEVAGGFVVPGLGLVTALFRRFAGEANFTVAEAPDGLRVRAGLLQLTSETIPFARVQAVRLVEPFLWRPFGWVRLEVDVAQQRQRDRRGEQDARQLSRALLPVGLRHEADALLDRVFPGLVLTPPPGSRPPRSARTKAPASYRLMAAWHDEHFMFSRTGRVTARTVVMPLAKMQSVRRTQGPVQRRLGLASVSVDSAGRRWVAHARDREAAQADAWVEQIAGHARAARAAYPR